MNLRKFAEGKPCMVRLPAICSGDPAETVLAHVRLSGISGAGLKAPDLLGAWCCSRCHEVTERKKMDDRIQRYFYEGVMRTQNELLIRDMVKW